MDTWVTRGILLLVALAARADIHRVPEEFPLLVLALQAAEAGDSVLVQPGAYGEDGLVLPAGVALIGLGEPGSAVIQGDGTNRLLMTNAAALGVNIQGMGFRGGHANLGAGLRILGGTARVEACVFEGNEATTGGGALELAGPGASEVVNCTFVDNRAPLGGAIRIAPEHNPLLSHCLISLNQGGPAVDAPIALRFPFLRHCDIVDNPGGDWTGILAGYLGVLGNLRQPPGFCEPTARVWTLAADSPCLPAGNPDGQHIGALGQGCEAGGLLARFSASLQEGPAPLVVEFQDLSAGEPDAWEWDPEGTGQWIAGGAVFTHAYTVAGSYTPRMRAFRNDTVSEAGLELPVVVRFSVTLHADPASGPQPLPVVFTAEPVGQPTSYTWNFGDGHQAVTPLPTIQHSYDTPGLWDVSVTATDGVNSAVDNQPQAILVYADTLRIPEQGTLAAAAPLIGPGTVVRLAPGTHPLPVDGLDLPPGAQVQGSPDAPSLIQLVMGSTPMFRVLGEGPLRVFEHVTFEVEQNQDALMCGDSADVALRNCVFRPRLVVNQNGYLWLSGGATVLADSCSFHRTSYGLMVYEASRLQETHCWHEAGFNVQMLADYTSRVEIRDSQLGGPLQFFGRSLLLENCDWTTLSGATLLLADGDSLRLDRVRIHGCTPSESLVMLQPGSHTIFRDCALVNNQAVSENLIQASGGARWRLESCVLAGNPGFMALGAGSAAPDAVTCTLIHGNTGGDWTGALAPFAGQDGNLDADPLLCDPDSFGLGVATDSPCLAVNNDCGVDMGGLPAACQHGQVTADFSVSVTEGVAPLIVLFTSHATGPVQSFQWDFDGNGTVDSIQENPVHIYHQEGHWDVTLRVSNPDSEDSITRDNLVFSNLPFTLHVPADYPTLALALQSADLGDTVEVACGTHVANDLSLPDGIVLRSATRLPDCARVEGSGNSRLFRGTDLTRGVLVEGLTLAGGRQTGAGIAGVGGAVLLTNSNTRFRSCVFTDNRAAHGGAGTASGGSALELEGCVVHGNSATGSSAAWMCTSAAFRLERCLVTDNTGAALFNRAPFLTCSDLFGNSNGDWTGSWADQGGVEGNLWADPLYCDTLAGDFRLLPDSPCLPPLTVCGPMGAFPRDCLTAIGPPREAPGGFSLLPATPNPFNPRTTLRFRLERPGHAVLAVFDVLGRRVALLQDGELSAGEHARTLEADALASGVYVAVLKADGRQASRKLLLVK
jgi:PKD repeat protein